MIELATLEQYFIDSEESSRTARQLSERSRDYYDNKQISDAIKKALKDRGQPVIVYNKIAQKVDFLKGTEIKTRTDPRAFPRTPDHDDGADAVTDAIRFVLDNNDFDDTASDVFENMTIEGTGAVSVEAVKKPKGIDISIKIIPWDRWGSDPHSIKKDYSDTRYTFVIAWKDIDDVKARWPNAANDIDAGMDLAMASDTYDDKPVRWFNKNRKRVMCVDMYFKHNQKWHKAIFAKGTWLDKPILSPYIDEDGLPENAHIAVSAKVKRDGCRYGLVEAWIDPQDEINNRRSKSVHILNSVKTFSKEGLITDINAFKKEANKSDGHLQFPNDGEFGKDFGIIPNEGLVGPQFSMYQDAISFLDSGQVNSALDGSTDRSLSGRALESLKSGGMVELGPLFSRHSHFKMAVYRAVWNRIKQFWREEKWIRVTDDEDNLKFVGLNQPVTIAEQRIADQTGQSVKEIRQEFKDELDEIHRMQPELAETAMLENNVVEMDVDIIIEEVPDVINMQSEQFDLLVQMYTANPNGIDWEDVIQMSTLRNKEKILNKELEPEEKQALEQKQAQEEELTQIGKAQAQAEIDATQAKAAKDAADAEAQIIENQATKAGITEFLEAMNG